MNLKNVLKFELLKKIGENQNIDNLIDALDRSLHITLCEYEIVSSERRKYYMLSWTSEDCEVDIDTYISLVNGSIKDDVYDGPAILVESVCLGSRDYQVLSYTNYRLDGVIENETIDYNERCEDEILQRKINRAKGKSEATAV